MELDSLYMQEIFLMEDTWPHKSILEMRKEFVFCEMGGMPRPLLRSNWAAALITSELGHGVSREFTIPNIRAGADLSLASYQAQLKLLPSSLVIALIVSLSLSVLIIVGSLVVFLLSQTW